MEQDEDYYAGKGSGKGWEGEEGGRGGGGWGLEGWLDKPAQQIRLTLMQHSYMIQGDEAATIRQLVLVCNVNFLPSFVYWYEEENKITRVPDQNGVSQA